MALVRIGIPAKPRIAAHSEFVTAYDATQRTRLRLITDDGVGALTRPCFGKSRGVVKIEKLSVGQTVYSVERHKMGNTTMSTTSVYHVLILGIDLADRSVIASWNGNGPRRYHEHSIGRWRKSKPLMIKSGMMGYQRLATRDEIKAANVATRSPEPPKGG